jgi:hypothetical protein
MTSSIAIMFAVAALFTLIGAGLLLALLRPASAGKVYAFRMIGIMALSLGIVLIMSASAMWHWSMA